MTLVFKTRIYEIGIYKDDILIQLCILDELLVKTNNQNPQFKV